ncbi:hypothetical protein LCGC14_0263970 [marine sediment metagenome]|uniref:Uncharacterized protein n=1 Tax=marine sediment metagenome TaxID=412755 RepID=A0A0F9X5L6_9ZZZZ
MSLPGIRNPDQIDYPRHVKDSVTTLPFFIGDETTLATTDVDETLVKVSALRRFENLSAFATGTHTGGAGAAVLTDSAGDFLDKGVEVGDTVNNTPDGSSATITAVTSTTITGVLSGGTSDDWQTGEAYTVDKGVGHQSSRAEEIRKIRIITDLDVYIRIDGDASSGSHTVRLDAGESMVEDNIRAVARISFINVTNPETPKLRWWVFGL